MLGERDKWASRGGKGLIAPLATQGRTPAPQKVSVSKGVLSLRLYPIIWSQCYRVLTPEQLTAARALLLHFADVFVDPSGKVGCINRVKHTRDTGDASPISSAFYRKSFPAKDEIEAEVNKMLSNDQIQPSFSPWASPVILAKKKDGNWRLACWA